ncbi:MAG TPA: protein kinase [Terriglobia bacterium]|nr:protein kinase [Terriglobia bacterium]
MNRPITKAGRYQIVSELGRGAMGVVYEGFDPVIGRAVAIKTMLTEGLSGNEFETYRARFQREAQAAGVLAHPNIVTIYDFGEDEGFLFLAMELLRGKSLEKLLQEQTVLPIETIIPIYQQVCSALDFAHQHKIVHRDIKPANIMILENGTVKVADFGIAKMLMTGMTRAGQILGTPNYMSPEQVKGRGVDGRSDIFALGVILYELITGEKPFAGQNVTTVIYKIMHENPISPRELEPTIHPGLSAVITRALAKNMDERYQTCAELAEDLKNYRNLGGQSSPSSTAVIQRPMLELGSNATAALDASMLRGATKVPTAGLPLSPSSPPAHPPQVQAPPRVSSPPAQVRVQATPQVRPPAAAPPARVAPAVVAAPPTPVAPRIDPPAPPILSKVSKPAPEPRASALLENRLDQRAPAPSVVSTEAPATQPAAVPAKRLSPLIWVGTAVLLVIAAAGGYFLPHRGEVASSNHTATSTPSVASPSANPSGTAPAGTTPSAAVVQGSEPAGQAGTPKTSQVSPAPAANQPSQHPQSAASEPPAKPTREHAAAAAIAARETPKLETSRPRTTVTPTGTGRLSITANVDGAKISIDGKGDADWIVPHTLSLPAGTHQVAVLKDGYVTWGKSVTVEAGGSQAVAAQLAPPTGEVDFITDPPGLEVFIDGKSVGVTPLQAMVSVGEHPYKINPPPGQRAAEGTVTAKETSIAKKTISFR